MVRYEYKVIPAPAKGRKGKGVKGPEARFAFGLQEVINEHAGRGWDYYRADILPSEERQGLTSTQTVYRSVLIFRRAVETAVPEPDAAVEKPGEAVEIDEETGDNDAPDDTEEDAEDDSPAQVIIDDEKTFDPKSTGDTLTPDETSPDGKDPDDDRRT